MKVAISRLLNEAHARIAQADDLTALANAMDTLLAAVVEIARELPDPDMTTKQKDHLAAAFDRGFPGEALR